MNSMIFHEISEILDIFCVYLVTEQSSIVSVTIHFSDQKFHSLLMMFLGSESCDENI